MTTSEKRAQLALTGQPWPDCDCHGEPKAWQRDATNPNGGYFLCRVGRREWRQRKRADRRAADLCIHCGKPAVTEILCRRCADLHADQMAHPYQQVLHRSADRAYDARQRTGREFQPTGAGFAAFAAWLRNPTGEVD